jgi:hypothetical protein
VPRRTPSSPTPRRLWVKASGFAHGRIASLSVQLRIRVLSSLVLGSELQAAEQKVDHPNCLPLPVLARPNVRHARERAK